MTLDEYRQNQIYRSKLPRWMQEKMDVKPTEASKEPYKNRYQRTQERLFHALTTEALSVQAARDWLDRSYKVIIDRAEELNNLEDQQNFKQLAEQVKAAIPLPEAQDEDVARSLNMLKQQIQPKDTDSDHLRDIKAHLVSEILGSVESAPAEQAPAPEAGAPAPAPMGQAPEQATAPQV